MYIASLGHTIMFKVLLKTYVSNFLQLYYRGANFKKITVCKIIHEINVKVNINNFNNNEQ